MTITADKLAVHHRDSASHVSCQYDFEIVGIVSAAERHLEEATQTDGRCKFCGMDIAQCAIWQTEDGLWGCNVGELRAVINVLDKAIVKEPRA